MLKYKYIIPFLFVLSLLLTCQAQAKDVLLAYGDSITHGFRNTPYSHFLQNKLDKGGFEAVVVNSGVNGEFTAEGADRITGVLQRIKPKYVFIMEGANDAIKNYSVEEIVKNIEHMIEQTQKYGAIPLLSTVTPNTRKDRVLSTIPDQINPAIVEISKKYNVMLVDNYTLLNNKWEKVQWDGLHPHNYGQLVMAEAWFKAYKTNEAMLAKKARMKMWSIIVLMVVFTGAALLFFRKRKNGK